MVSNMTAKVGFAFGGAVWFIRNGYFIWKKYQSFLHHVVLRLDQFSLTDRTRNRSFEKLEIQCDQAYATRDFCRKLRDLIKEAVLYYHCEIFALK